MKEAAEQASGAWAALMKRIWVVDKLHFWYHTGCRDPGSSYYVEEVDPYKYPEIVGMDTEAAEQIFHIADRWQVILSNTAPVHQELFMLLFAQAHNETHSCQHALQTFASHRAAKQKTGDRGPPPPPPPPAGEAGCSVKRPAKRQKAVGPRACDSPAPESQAPQEMANASPDAVDPAPNAGFLELAVRTTGAAPSTV